MKILRIRRGYTTNSSSYTEWLPPPAESTANGQAAGPSSGAASAGQAQPAAQTPAGAPSATQAVAPPAGTAGAQQPASPAAGNGLIVGGLLAGVLALFLGERLIRLLRRKGGEPSDGDES